MPVERADDGEPPPHASTASRAKKAGSEATQPGDDKLSADAEKFEQDAAAFGTGHVGGVVGAAGANPKKSRIFGSIKKIF